MNSKKIIYITLFCLSLFNNNNIYASTIKATGIANSMHNFSVFWMSNANGDALDEICAFCHTPHNADQTVVDAPLWSHTLSTTTYIPYTSNTTNAQIGQPNGSSKLCLSCHDGTVAIDSYGSNSPTGHVGLAQLLVGDFAPQMNLGADLKNDHPISFVYDTTLSTMDKKLRDPSVATILPGVNSAVGTVKSALLDKSNQVQCTSCHDIHNAQGIDKLLKVNNTGSALCLTCHNI